MTPADERILKLLEKWRTSLDLHARYASLSDDEYWLVQPWPKHQRPTGWVIQLARQRLDDLERIVKGRLAAGDASLSEALEMMSFMTQLIGVQNVERFVPVAEPEQERPLTDRQARARADRAVGMPASAGRPAPPPAAIESTGERQLAADRTVEMPIAGDSTVELQLASGSTAEMPAPFAAPPAANDAETREDERELEVVRDAVRLLSWGREWHELPEAIARMAGRPDKARVRSILQAHRAAIERQTDARSRAR